MDYRNNFSFYLNTSIAWLYWNSVNSTVNESLKLVCLENKKETKEIEPWGIQVEWMSLTLAFCTVDNTVERELHGKMCS